jgi:hypothetical protein
MAKPVGFTREAATRIADAVRKVESRDNGGGGAGWHGFRADDPDPVRLGRTSAAWNKGTLATITVFEGGTPPNETASTPTETLANCVNKFANVATGKWVIVARGGNGYWYLISAEC